MTLRVAPSTPLLPAPRPQREATWTAFLQARLTRDWRPGEFDAERLIYIPNVGDPDVWLRRCRRAGCGVVLDRAELCVVCWKEWRSVQADGVDLATWAAAPRIRTSPAKRFGCEVADCPRSHAQHGLCSAHVVTFKAFRDKQVDGSTVAQWINAKAPRALPAVVRCIVPDCWRDRAMMTGLCTTHDRSCKDWLSREHEAATADSVAAWVSRMPEPFLDPATRQTYASAAATPFGLLPEPLRWEFLYAVQQRDLRDNAKLAPVEVRATYASLRSSGWTTAVGRLESTRAPGSNRSLRSMLGEWQRIIDAAHREWSGVDDRDPKVIYLAELTLRHNKRVGPGSTMNLRGIETLWVLDTVSAWARAAPRAAHECYQVATSWTLVDEVLRARSTRREELGVLDMDAIVNAVRARAPHAISQKRVLLPIQRVCHWARAEPSLQQHWGDIAAGFMIDPVRHRAQGDRPRSSRTADEPFRFVPQPIIDWVMDHLHLLERGDAYATAEARAMVYVHERCGRRTSETTTLREDCISYDNEGAPYLEWRQGKPPYAMGKRLPIHQETHDVIRQWQHIKREHSIESEWLFPSITRRRRDQPVHGQALNRRVRYLVDAVLERAPFPGPAEGADGNLVHFDLTTIDPYAFRHAFAQRLADATDADGRSTTPPDVLQEFMGHKNFNTTMAYYEVTTRRRKKAMAALAPRRLDLHGHVVPVDRERDGFTKIAVTLGHCSEPQNVAAGGHGCMIDHACESCPFFLVDPLERDGMGAKREALMVKLERARVIDAPQHLLDHYEARIKDTSKIIDGIDAYMTALPSNERDRMREALDHMADIRLRATAARRIDLRTLLTEDRKGAEHG